MLDPVYCSFRKAFLLEEIGNRKGMIDQTFSPGAGGGMTWGTSGGSGEGRERRRD